MGAGWTSPFGQPAVIRRFARRAAWLSGPMAVVLAVTLLGQPAQAAEPWQPPQPTDVAGVPVVDATVAPGRPAWTAEASAVRGPRDISWPEASSSVVDVPPGSDRAQAAGSPVAIGRVPASAESHDRRHAPAGDLGRVTVTVYDQSATAKAGRNGLLVSLARADAKAGIGRAAVQLSYAGFAAAYGGDWAARLGLVALPACALSTPELAECQTGTRVPAVNDTEAGTLTAQVTLDGGQTQLLSMGAGPSGDNGDYTATGLSPAGTWQVSTQTGDFSWSVPMRMPPALGGPAPSVSLSYSSGSVDGRTGDLQ